MADKRAQSRSQSCDEPAAKRPSDAHRICPHCSQSVSERTFYRHKRLFYSYSTKTWQTEGTETGYDHEEAAAEEDVEEFDEVDSDSFPGSHEATVESMSTVSMLHSQSVHP